MNSRTRITDAGGRKRRRLTISPRAAAVLLALWAACGAPAQGAVVRIMPLGDSLTSSIPGQASYRYWLAKRLTWAGFNYDFVGSQWGVGSGAPKYDFDANHEAYGGVTTTDIFNGVEAWARAARPQVVILLIGANDLDAGVKIGPMITNVRNTIYKLRRVNPYVKVLLLKQPPLTGLYWRVYYWNWALANMAGVHSTANSPIYMVDLWTNWSIQNDTVDGTHPNAAGEKIMANRIYATLAYVMNGFGQYARY